VPAHYKAPLRKFSMKAARQHIAANRSRDHWPPGDADASKFESFPARSLWFGVGVPKPMRRSIFSISAHPALWYCPLLAFTARLDIGPMLCAGRPSSSQFVEYVSFRERNLRLIRRNPGPSDCPKLTSLRPGLEMLGTFAAQFRAQASAAHQSVQGPYLAQGFHAP